MIFNNEQKELAIGQVELIGRIRAMGNYLPHNSGDLAENESALISTLEGVGKSVANPNLSELFDAAKCLLKACFLLTKWRQAVLTAAPDASRFLDAAKANAGLILIAETNIWYDGPCYKQMMELKNSISMASTLADVGQILSGIATLSLPFLFAAPKAPASKPTPSTSQSQTVDKAPVITVVFHIDGQPWQNPQVFTPGLMINITGTIKMEEWPKDCDRLILHHVTTTDDSWFNLSLTIVEKTGGTTQQIQGSIIFNKSQRYNSDPMVIKLFAQFLGSGPEKLKAFLVGYDELKVNIYDKHSYPELTVHPLMNEKIIEINTDIEKNLHNLSRQRKEDFLFLLAGVLSYVIHCTQRGIYKGRDNVKEAEFRDNMIAFLDADKRLTKAVVKESELGGGRVEIVYNDIPVELKVERSVQTRKKVIDKYKKQPVTYATASDTQLSILCILEMTKKKSAPALTANNVFLIEPEYNGFENEKPEIRSRLVIAFIDANTGDPSKK